MVTRKRGMTANTDRLNSRMDAYGLAAVVLRSGMNFTYLSGIVYPGTLARLQDLTDSERGVLLLWPREGEPVIIANSIAAALARRDSWVRRVALHEGYVESGWVAAILMGDFIGWLAEKYMGSRMGMLVNITIGVIGAVVASALLSWFGSTWAGWIGYLVGGFAGACVLISAVRMIKGF